MVNEWSHDIRHDPTFTQSELDRSMASFNPEKAPGADGFTTDICAQAIKHTTTFRRSER